MVENVTSLKKTARVAGLLYLLAGGTGVFYLMHIPSTFIVPGNAAATASRITNSESLFRIGIVVELISAVSFIFLVLALQHLLKEVNKTYASLMVKLVLISVPISFINALNAIAALVLLNGNNFDSVFNKPQLDALVMFFLKLHGYGFVVVQVFWGLWLFPFGMLVFRSGFIPRLIGVFLIAACFAYLIVSFTSLIFPQYQHIVFKVATIPQGLGEGSVILWLLIKGVKNKFYERKLV